MSYHEHIVPELLACETSLVYLRDVTRLAYVREGIVTVDPSGNLPTDYFTLPAPIEIVAFAMLTGRQPWALGRRRAWWLFHHDGTLDGVDWPAVEGCPYHCALVAPKSVRWGKYSEVVAEKQDVSDGAIVEARTARDRALSTWEANDKEQARLRKVREDRDAKRAEQLHAEQLRTRNPYKMVPGSE